MDTRVLLPFIVLDQQLTVRRSKTPAEKSQTSVLKLVLCTQICGCKVTF